MMLLSLILSLLVAMAVPMAGSTSARPQAGPTPRIISITHDVHFPDEIVLRLEAEAEVPVREITLFYTLGRKRATVYGYPTFRPGTHVAAEFRIKTGGASYIPSGTDIEYYYVLRDEAGQVLETPRTSLEYKDLQYEWQRLEHGPLVFLWHDRPESEVRAAAAEVAPRVETVQHALGLESVQPVKAVILNSGREAQRSFPLISDTTRREHVFGGFAYGEYGLFLLVGLGRDGLVHEATHLLLDQALDSPLAMVPSWLNEGLAMYFEPGPRGRDLTVEQAARDNRLLPLRAMKAVPGRPQDIYLFYAQARSIVSYMMTTYGEGPMRDLLRLLNEGKTIEEALQRAYGKSLEALEREWKAGLTGEAPASPSPGPGALGTAAIVAGAAIIAMVAYLVKWLLRATGMTRAGDSPPDDNHGAGATPPG